MENTLQKSTAPRKLAFRTDRLTLVMAVLYTLAYLITLAEPSETRQGRVVTAVVGLGSLTVAIFAYPQVQRRGSVLAAALYLLVQFALNGVLMFIGGVGLGITLMLLIALAQASRFLSLWWALAFCLYLPAIHIGMSWQDVARQGLGFLVAGIFVVLITRVAVTEQRLRAEKEALAEELGEVNQQLRSFALQVEELAAIKERNRLAREIHDSLGHHLTTIHVQLQAAKAVLRQDTDKAEAALEKARTLTQDALADVRRSVAALRTLERPLPEALALLAKETSAAGTPTELTVSGTPRHLGPHIEGSLYRIAQEGLTNVRKHAQATQCVVTLMYQPQTIELCIKDDGVGTSDSSGGFGLLGVRERVALLNGELQINTAPQRGLKLQVSVPG
jgi:signal transduction histidine kinase